MPIRIYIRPNYPHEPFSRFLERQLAHARPGARERLAADGMALESLHDIVTLITDPAEAITNDTHPELLVVTSDEVIAQVLPAMREAGIRVPGDKSILGVEDNPRYLGLNISTCRVEPDRLGYVMAHAIIQDFTIEKNERGFIGAQASLIKRLTTA